MTQTCKFDSLLDDTSRDVFDCVVDIGVRTWPPSGVYSIIDDGRVHLFYVLDGILACQRLTHLTRVLPREVLRIGRGDERELENPSRSDSATAIQITFVPDDNTPMTTEHVYFSDDQKDNRLCRVAGYDGDKHALKTRAPIEVFLTTLGRYDTLLLDREAQQPVLVLCARGDATVNTVPLGAKERAITVETDTATIVGRRPCTILTLRGTR